MTDKFPVMLASPMKELHRITFPCIAQTKMDGMRAILIKRKGVVNVYSRNGNKLIKLDKHFTNVFGDLDDVMLDGELTVVGADGKLLDRKAGNGIIHKAVESVGTISDEEVCNIRLTLWDIVTVAEFDSNEGRLGALSRLAQLELLPVNGLFNIVYTTHIKNMEEAEKLFKEMLDKGEEGIILKNLNHLWEAKRSKQIVKMKEIIEVDYKIVGFTEGEGKASGMTGAIQVENKDGTIKCSVGTGMDDAKRIEIWGKRNTLIGTIITLRHNGIISSKGKSTKSVFLPRFVELRPDKGEADL